MAVKCPLQSHTAPSDLGRLRNALCLPLSGQLLAQQKRCSSTSVAKHPSSNEEVYFEMVIAVWSFPEKGCIKLCGGGLDKGYRNYHITPSNEGQSSCLVCAATKFKKLGILQTITGMANLSKKVMKFDGPFFENRHFEPVQAQCSTGPASVSRGKSRARVRPRIAPDFLRKLFTSRQNLRHPSLHAGRHGLK